MTDSTKPQGPIHRRIPEGDSLERLVCNDCGFINYVNPKLVVGVVATWQDKILLAKRAIEPRYGYWTLPAGFMECEESTWEGAAREAWEEACAAVEPDGLLAIYDLPHISQVQVFYRAKLTSPDVAIGSESLDVGLYTWADIPWADLAFPTVKYALEYFHQTQNQAVLFPETRTIRPVK